MIMSRYAMSKFMSIEDRDDKIMKDKEAERIINVFRKNGLTIELGSQFSVKGQVAQLLNSSEDLTFELEAKARAFDWLAEKDYLIPDGKYMLESNGSTYFERSLLECVQKAMEAESE